MVLAEAAVVPAKINAPPSVARKRGDYPQQTHTVTAGSDVVVAPMLPVHVGVAQAELLILMPALILMPVLILMLVLVLMPVLVLVPVPALIPMPALILMPVLLLLLLLLRLLHLVLGFLSLYVIHTPF